MIAIVIDTNVFVSAYLKGGLPLQVLDTLHTHKTIGLTTIDMLNELRATLLRPKFVPYFTARGLDINQLIDAYVAVVSMVTPSRVTEVPLRDVKDFKVLECAISGNADYIVSGDKDLLVLNTINNISIVTPQQFLDLIDLPAK